jgi:plastocyanin
MGNVKIMRRFSLRLFFIIFFFISCTSSQKKEAPANEEETYPTENDLPAMPNQKAEPKVHIVEIKQMKFQPSEVKVHKGDKVLWINKDITNHDVTEQASKAWASSPLSTGESWSLEVTQSVDYFCNLHQVMKGKIIVE